MRMIRIFVLLGIVAAEHAAFAATTFTAAGPIRIKKSGEDFSHVTDGTVQVTLDNDTLKLQVVGLKYGEKDLSHEKHFNVGVPTEAKDVEASRLSGALPLVTPG